MPIVGNAYQEAPNVMGEGIGQVLNMVLQGVGSKIQHNKDKAYRSSAAKILGIPESELGYFQREELKDLVKERYKSNQEIEREKLKPREWKPTTKEEAIAIEEAKSGVKSEETMKSNYVKYRSEKEKIGGTPVSYTEFKKLFNEDVAQPAATEPGIGDTVRGVIGTKSKGEGIGGLLKKLLKGYRDFITPQHNSIVAPTTQQQPAAIVDPIAERIQQALSKGMDPAEVARMLKEKGVDPAKYGL